MPIRTLTELVQNGGLFTAENVIRHGGSIAELTRAYQHRYGGDFVATGRTVRDIYNRAIRSVADARELGTTGTLSGGDIPNAPLNIRRGSYEYRTIVETRIRTGPRRYQTTTRRDQVTITSRDPLTAAEIRERIRGLIGLELGMDTLPGGLGDFVRGGRITSVTSIIILSVYRAT